MVKTNLKTGKLLISGNRNTGSLPENFWRDVSYGLIELTHSVHLPMAIPLKECGINLVYHLGGEDSNAPVLYIFRYL